MIAWAVNGQVKYKHDVLQDHFSLDIWLLISECDAYFRINCKKMHFVQQVSDKLRPSVSEQL